MSVKGLCEGLNNLSSNDINKSAIIKHGGIPVLASVIRLKFKKEKEAKQEAVEALWKLAFIESNVEIILTHLTFADTAALEGLKKLQSSDDSRLREASKGLLHQIGLIDIHDELPEQKADSSADQPQDPPPSYEDAMRGLHVMISYNWEHQDRAIKIRDRLKQKGHNVWMDVDKMRGNILMAMADGVEKADAMLMCYSRKYKGSAFCQAEANYAFKLHKPIIPVQVEEAYDADGWLGLLTGMYIYVKAYSDEVMEENWPHLLRELENVRKV
ncbi:uncharacterized protein [Amphiura filiformis]|uniref:uncharacterized protein n=1 Tax=Amphiura filiformis TaxID=82378 RepID=UPI003B214D31